MENTKARKTVSFSQSNSTSYWRNTRRSLKKTKQNVQESFRTFFDQHWPLRNSTRIHLHQQQSYKGTTNGAVPSSEWQQTNGGLESSKGHNSQNTQNPPSSTASSTYQNQSEQSGQRTDKPSIVVYRETPMPGRLPNASFGSPRLEQRTIRFHDDEDPGVMSEVDTSATGGTYGRRNPRVRTPPAKNLGAHITSSSAIAADNDFDKNNNANYNSSSSISNLSQGPENSVGLVFLHYQGETKRALLPDELRTFEDIKNMFFKTFPSVFNMDYLHSSHVKIYIQDPARQDVFYELEDLRDVKDRTVLKLHEQSRPLSPTVSLNSQTALGSGAYGVPSDHPTSSVPAPAPPVPVSAATGTQQQYPRDPEMNYFSESEIDNVYRNPRSLAGFNTSGAGGSGSPGAPFQRRYGTLEAYYRSSDRVKYGAGLGTVGPPAKPQRFAGTTTPTRGLTVGQQQNNGRPLPSTLRTSYGSSGESEVESFTSRNYSNNFDGTNNFNIPPISRSGSVTPVIDEEARARMLNMEKQLANLSSLVHSALMAKGVGETVYKDIEVLRREILGPPSSNRDDTSDSGSVSRFSDVSSDKGSFTLNDRDCSSTTASGNNASNQQNSPPERDIYSTAYGGSEYPNRISPEMKQLLKSAKKRTSELQIEIKYLRRMAQVNAQSARDVLKDSFDRLRVILNTNKHLHMFAAQAKQQNSVENNPLLSDRSWVNQEQDRYRNLMKNIEQELDGFEKHVEDLRHRVINGEKRLRISEVESFTESLTNISKSAANLKTQFPSLEERLKTVMSGEMEKVVREEKFLKDEPYRLDTALKRCKKLTNTMVTMKKLALVQDPNAYRNDKAQSPPSNNSNNQSNGNQQQQQQQQLTQSPPLLDATYADVMNSTSFMHSSSLKKNTRYNSDKQFAGSNNTESSKVLDSLLEELQNVAKGGGGGETPTTKHQNGEKRVGFNDHVKHIVLSDKEESDSDTIKRSPKTNLLTVAANNNLNNNNHVTNAAYEKSVTSQNNGHNNGYDENMNINLPTSPKEQQLPIYSKLFSSKTNGNGNSFVMNNNKRNLPYYTETAVTSRYQTMSPQLTQPNRERSHSGTPISVASEPASFDRYQPVIPPPPPRSSSRSAVYGSGISTNTSTTLRNYSRFTTDANELKHQLNYVNGISGRTTLAPPAIVQTNAVDEDSNNRGLKSASSSESVNSQEALQLSIGLRPPPPPPPPRNKQEMLEQRHQELLAKQKRFQTQYTKLQDTKRQQQTNGHASSQYI